MLNHRLLAIATTAVVGLSLTACGGSDSASSSDPSATSSAAPAQAKKGGTLIMGTAGELPSFDPTKSFGMGPLYNPLLAVYDTLMRPGSGSTGEVKPNLAESMTSSADLKTWTMKLKPGVKFSNGETFDATAVKANIARHQDPAVKSQSVSLVSDIKQMTVVDPTTLQFTLGSPNTAFPNVFTLQPGVIAAPTTLAAGYALDSKPIGAGPFVVASWQRDAAMKLTRNPTYFQSGLPYLDALELRPIANTTTRLSSLRTGDIQMTTYNNQIDINSALKEDSLSVDVTSGDGGDVLYLNARKAPLDDLRIRQALAKSMDPAALSAVMYGGKMVAANGPFTPESPYYLKDNGYPTYDVAGAKALVAAYKADHGGTVPKIGIMGNNVPDRVRLAQMLQGFWNEIGIESEIQPVEAAETSSRFAKFDFQVGIRQIATFIDPEPGLSRWFISTSSSNFSGIVNPALDKALTEGKTSGQPAARVAAYQEASRQLAAQLPALWYAHGNRAFAHSKNVTIGPDNLGADSLYFQQVGFIG